MTPSNPRGSIRCSSAKNWKKASVEITISKHSRLLTALDNSGVAAFYLDILSPTMNYLPGHINSIPIHAEILKDERVEETAHNAISESKEDWDAYETSWDFKRNPLV